MDLTTILIVLGIIILVVILVTIARKNKKNPEANDLVNPKAEAGGNEQAAETAPPSGEAYGTDYIHKEDAPKQDTEIPEVAEKLKSFEVHPNAWCAGDSCQLRIAYKHSESGNIILAVRKADGGAEQQLSTEAEFEKVYKPGDAPFDSEGEYIVTLKKDGKLIGEKRLFALPEKGGAVKVHSHVVMPVQQDEFKRTMAKNTVVLSQFTTGKHDEFIICSKGAVLTGITLLQEGRHALCGRMELAVRRKSELVMEYGELVPGEYVELTPNVPIDKGIHLQMTQYCGDEEFPSGEVVEWDVKLMIECADSGRIHSNPEEREFGEKD